MGFRRSSIAAAAVIVVIFMAYGAYWFAVAALIRDGVADWAEARRAEGYEVTYDSIDVVGFPGRLLVTLDQPKINDGATWRWQTAALIAEASPFALDRIILALPPSQRIDYARGGKDRSIVVQMERGTALITLVDGAVDSLDMEAENIIAETPRGPLSLASLAGRMERRPAGMISLSLDGREITLTPNVATDLGRDMAVFGFTGVFAERLVQGGLAEWSAEGGAVEVERLALEWGAVRLDATGTATLDEKRRPEAAFSAALSGYGQVLDQLAADGRMKPRDASFAKTFLNLMAKKKSGRRVIKVAITAQNGKLFIGPLPLFRLAPIDAW